MHKNYHLITFIKAQSKSFIHAVDLNGRNDSLIMKLKRDVISGLRQTDAAAGEQFFHSQSDEGRIFVIVGK